MTNDEGLEVRSIGGGKLAVTRASTARTMARLYVEGFGAEVTFASGRTVNLRPPRFVRYALGYVRGLFVAPIVFDVVIA